ncbi:DUF624 domain-containing protein [Egicoccus sp. AB-alg6-2]|uniref:DUF624 domain-containing protein n=1 Tax=Egicoccus sp. AB-alg6-2 TaxID=3242692 RepID=UPI00359E74CF
MGDAAPMKGERWETRMLGWLEHPVNLVVGNLVWFVLVLPVVTWLSAAVALAYGIDRWFGDGDDRMVRNVLEGWRLTWRRTLPLGVVSGTLGLMLALNALFLSTRPPGVATVLLGGTGALGLVWLAVNLWLVPVLARHHDLPLRVVLAMAATAAVRQAPVTVVLAVLTVLLVGVLVVFWTFLPFLSAAVVVTLSLRALDRAESA